MKYKKYFDFGLKDSQGNTESSGVLVVEADVIGERMYANIKVKPTIESQIGCLSALNQATDNAFFQYIGNDVIEGDSSIVSKDIYAHGGDLAIFDCDDDEIESDMSLYFTFKMAEKD